MEKNGKVKEIILDPGREETGEEPVTDSPDECGVTQDTLISLGDNSTGDTASDSSVRQQTADNQHVTPENQPPPHLTREHAKTHESLFHSVPDKQVSPQSAGTSADPPVNDEDYKLLIRKPSKVTVSLHSLSYFPASLCLYIITVPFFAYHMKH